MIYGGYDVAIMAAYVLGIAIISRRLIMPALVFFAVMNVGEYKTSLDDVYLFSLFGAIYLAVFYYICIITKKLEGFGFLIISAYYMTYAIDCWINSTYETWIWTNHENIVVVLHVASILLFSSVLTAVVRSSNTYISRLCFNGQRDQVIQRYKHSKTTTGSIK